MEATIGITVAVVAAAAGYLFRRREHLRERRLVACEALLSAFMAAARSAAQMSSTHTQLGWPEHLSSADPVAGEMRAALESAWSSAMADRRAFEVAAFGADLVGSMKIRGEVETLRTFLVDVAYSGSPWKRGPIANRDVVASRPIAASEIEPEAIDVARQFVSRVARELWSREAPAPKKALPPAS